MLQHSVMRLTTSPWAFSDQRKLWHHSFLHGLPQCVTRKDLYPLPCIDDILDALSGTRMFTILDLAGGLTGKSRWMLLIKVFTTGHGLFESQGMPFGICNAPVTFQRLVEFASLAWHPTIADW